MTPPGSVARAVREAERRRVVHESSVSHLRGVRRHRGSAVPAAGVAGAVGNDAGSTARRHGPADEAESAARSRRPARAGTSESAAAARPRPAAVHHELREHHRRRDRGRVEGQRERQGTRASAASRHRARRDEVLEHPWRHLNLLLRFGKGPRASRSCNVRHRRRGKVPRGSPRLEPRTRSGPSSLESPRLNRPRGQLAHRVRAPAVAGRPLWRRSSAGKRRPVRGPGARRGERPRDGPLDRVRVRLAAERGTVRAPDVRARGRAQAGAQLGLLGQAQQRAGDLALLVRRRRRAPPRRAGSRTGARGRTRSWPVPARARAAARPTSRAPWGSAGGRRRRRPRCAPAAPRRARAP